jgi:hypothetical protein
MNIVFLNGPPGAGKDTIGDLVCDKFDDIHFIPAKFAEFVKLGTHGAYCLWDEHDRVLPADHFEDCKEVPHEGFLGLTPREAYIKYSEEWMKPSFGRNVFGKMIADKFKKALETSEGGCDVIFTDCGFKEEVEEILKVVDAKDVIIIRLHREGRDYSNDSREAIYIEGVRSFDVTNIDDKPSAACLDTIQLIKENFPDA